MRCQKRDYAGATEILNALLTMENATKHIASQYAETMTRPQAMAHFEARSIILKARIRVHNEATERFPWFRSMPIIQAEVDDAISKKKTPQG